MTRATSEPVVVADLFPYREVIVWSFIAQGLVDLPAGMPIDDLLGRRT